MSLDHPINFGSADKLLNQTISTNDFSQVIVFGDQNTLLDCYSIIESSLISGVVEMPAGEVHKNITITQNLWGSLMEHNADRKSLLVNLGGGVVTDLGGFAASCYKRGIQFINIPTSLLAMVDASVGGKTGIDFANIKNSIGTFANPLQVIIDEQFLNTLPSRQFNNGKAEILKHGFIADANHLNTLDEAEQTNSWEKVIEESVSIKKSIVLSDPYEKGLRKILNFGHTIGHAIESFSLQNDDDPLLHGEAIAMGMIAEAELSISYCGLTTSDFEEVRNRILNYFSIRHYSVEIIPELIELMQNDKKNVRNEIQMSLLEKIGKATYGVHVSIEDITKSLQQIFQ